LHVLFESAEIWIVVGRYVIMPDHVHLFAAFPIVGSALSSWIQSLRTVMGKTLLRLEIPKPHWQEGLLRSFAAQS
jgi:hypothetical protein